MRYSLGIVEHTARSLLGGLRPVDRHYWKARTLARVGPGWAGLGRVAAAGPAAEAQRPRVAPQPRSGRLDGGSGYSDSDAESDDSGDDFPLEAVRHLADCPSSEAALRALQVFYWVGAVTLDDILESAAMVPSGLTAMAAALMLGEVKTGRGWLAKAAKKAGKKGGKKKNG